MFFIECVVTFYKNSIDYIIKLYLNKCIKTPVNNTPNNLSMQSKPFPSRVILLLRLYELKNHPNIT